MVSQPFAIPALIIFIIAVPLVFGLIPRNRFYGFRTARTLSDDRIWYAVNRLGGIAIMVGSCLYGLVAALAPYDRYAHDNSTVWAIHLAAFIGPLVIAVALVFWYSRRL